MSGERLPITVLTGFLGSGKTTLLRHLIAQPALADTAVIINEFGEVGLDHLLVEAAQEDTVLLASGCLCCTVRGDLVASLRRLLMRSGGEPPPFRRVVIETTGLADPAPIIQTLMTDPLLGDSFRLDGIVTTIDAVNGTGQLDRQSESVKQAAVADRLVLTKTDLALADDLALLSERLRKLNPSAPILSARNGEIEPALLFDAGLYNPETKSLDVRRWLNDEAYASARADGHHHHRHDVNRHDDHIRAFCLSWETPLDWGAFVDWAEMLTATQGERLLRLKGVLNIVGVDGPVAVHAVQHLFHPPVELAAWPDEDRCSRIVFITRDLTESAIREQFAAFVRR